MRKYGKNYLALLNAYKNNQYAGASLEGSSRSRKTWDSIYFLLHLTSRHLKGKKIIITRETFNSFRTTLYDDFKRCFDLWSISHPFGKKDTVTQFDLFGNVIHLMGADDPNKFEGVGSDIFWMNEVLDQPHTVFDQLEQRCRMFFWTDYNPKALEHWYYDATDNRQDILKLHTTFRNNPYISDGEERKILSYEPWHPDDYHLPPNKRRPHSINVPAGTADEYRWNVYGLGLRSAREGSILKNWEMGQFDENLPFIYGQDFGTKDPDAFIKVAVDRTKMRIYVKEEIYQTGLSTNDLAELMWNCYVKNKLIIGDSAAKRTIQDLKGKGFNIKPVIKTPIVDGLKAMMDWRIIVHPGSNNIKKELVDYVWLDKKGEVPIDENNHAIDAIRYAFITLVKPLPTFKGHKAMKSK